MKNPKNKLLNILKKCTFTFFIIFCICLFFANIKIGLIVLGIIAFVLYLKHLRTHNPRLYVGILHFIWNIFIFLGDTFRLVLSSIDSFINSPSSGYSENNSSENFDETDLAREYYHVKEDNYNHNLEADSRDSQTVRNIKAGVGAEERLRDYEHKLDRERYFH